MKKVLLICVSCLICLSGCTNNNKENYNYLKEEEIEKEIIENLAKITEVTNPTSSNPYEYIENEYYNNIVNLGKEAVPVLENMYIKIAFQRVPPPWPNTITVVITCAL